MKNLMNDVAAFHKACGVPVLGGLARFPPLKRVLLRTSLKDEESRELDLAIEQRDILGVADAIGDLIYVLVGMALEFGIPLDQVWAAIQTANMAKVDPETGEVVRREDGKILKPDGWAPPDIAQALLKETA